MGDRGELEHRPTTGEGLDRHDPGSAAHASRRTGVKSQPTQPADLRRQHDEVDKPPTVSPGSGYFGPATLQACAKRGIEPYIATGRDPHHPSWQQRFAPLPDPPPEDASAQVKMAYKLRTALGKAIYGARKCTVEPVIGIIKEVLGFRQFSLRGVLAAADEWCLVCLAFNLKRFHTLSWA